MADLTGIDYQPPIGTSAPAPVPIPWPVSAAAAPEPTREVMDTHQAAAYLGLTRMSLYKYMKAEKIPCFRLGDRYLFKLSVLDEWMAERSRANWKTAKK